jgi:hypothetical protein
MCICVPEALEKAVASYTDAGEWKCSWHWARDRTKSWSPITLKGAQQMLDDLKCDSMENEIAAMTRRIERRYRLAGELRRLIHEAIVRKEADSHPVDCACEVCVAVGYAPAAQSAERSG